MAIVILVRHGRTPANADGVLAGRAPGIHLDEVGRAQADAAGERLAGLPVTRVASSPLERTLETAQAVARRLPGTPGVQREEGLIECGYGAWTGRSLKELAKERLWRTVQAHPSAVRFPEGESLPAMQARAVSAVRSWDALVTAQNGDDALWVAVSHGDVIKAVVADALGLHLDSFQRLVAGPGSLSVIRYTEHRPFVLHVNDTGSDLSGLKPPTRRRRRRRSSDAVVGGGAGGPAGTA
ncbi:MAG: histidine phosphatase family protein [Nocardioidaceae bacterium]